MRNLKSQKESVLEEKQEEIIGSKEEMVEWRLPLLEMTSEKKSLKPLNEHYILTTKMRRVVAMKPE